MGTAKSPTRRVVDDFDERIDAALAQWPRPDRRRDGADERMVRILARIEAEKGRRSSDRPLMNAPLWAEVLPRVRRPPVRGPWMLAGGASTVVLASAAAITLITGVRGDPRPRPIPAVGSALVVATASPLPVMSSTYDAVDPSALPRASIGVGAGLGAFRQGRSAVSSAAPATAAPVLSPPSPVPGPKSEIPVPVGAPRTVGSSGDVGSVPLRPAAGAAESAVSQVLPSARACLAPGQGMVRATITFRSDGQVKDIVVGPEASDPVATCVRGALAAARIGAFAMPTFVWTTTVRGP